MGRDKQLELEDSDAQETAAGGLESKFFLPVTGGYPQEAPLEKRRSSDTGSEPADIQRLLLNFYLYGMRPEKIDSGDFDSLVVPALTYPYCDLSRSRHDFPFCIDDKQDPVTAIRTLPGIIDGLIEKIDIGGDEGERLKQQIYRLESEIRTLSADDHGAGILGLWDRAARNLINASQLDEERKELFRDNLATVRQGIDCDYEMISCNAETAETLFNGLMGIYWKEKCREWRKELDSLIQHLSDILQIDFSYSTEARSAEHLRDASGTHTDDFDFSAFSTILTTSQPGNELPVERRDRIQSSLGILLRARPVYAPDLQSGGPETESTFPLQSVVFDDCDTALEAYDSRMKHMVDFFKAVQIARLECNNAYRESFHDEYYRRFNISYLTEDELLLCPPVLVKLEDNYLAKNGPGKLLELLNSGFPFKVLLQVNDLYAHEKSQEETSILLNWRTNLASMVTAMTGSYVLQAPVSNLSMLHSGFLAGLEYAGPSLFSVYAGDTEHRPDLPTYLNVSSAAESRVFPAFSCDPSRGQDMTDRIDVLVNSQADNPWPVESFTYRTADGNDASVNVAFTAADFLLNDRRLTDHFWTVPRDLWHEEMVPLHEYLQMSSSENAVKIPYILTVDQAGQLGRTLVSRSVVVTSMHCQRNWRHLQELGGINNSHALKLLDAEKNRLADEKRQEVAAIEAEYNRHIEQDLGKLTGEIVQRIAGRLILETGTGALPIPPPAPPQTAKAQEIPAETAEVKEEAPPAAVEEEDEEIESLDDPYIITQLCTSCNDCININKELFAYDKDKRAYIKDPDAGTYEQLVRAAEKCPVHVIRPGKPRNPDEPGLEDLLKRAAQYQ